jgi:hypothetical protein
MNSTATSEATAHADERALHVRIIIHSPACRRCRRQSSIKPCR